MELPKPFLSRIIKSLEEIEQHIKPEQKMADNLFVPSQPRGDNGQWVKGSGTSGGGNKTPDTKSAPTPIPTPLPKPSAKSYVNLTRQGKETTTQAAHRIYAESSNKDEYIKNVYNYAVLNTEYQRDPEGIPWVRGPETALNSGIGDCSERAQIAQKMLAAKNIPSQIVYGQIEDTRDADWHATVELHNKDVPYIIDAADFPNFVKRGAGLHPNERVKGD